MAFSRAQWLGAIRKALLGIGLCFSLLGIALVLRPPWYESTARIKVAPPDIGVTRAVNWPACDDVRSQAILFPVITNLNLCEKWARGSKSLQVEQAYPLLRKRLLVQQASGTSLLEIRVRDRDPNQAAAIANEIASVYRGRNAKISEAATAVRIKALETDYEQADERLKTAQAIVERVGSSRVDLQACKLEYSIVSPK